MLYAMLILLAIAVAFLLLSVRVRFQLSDGEKLLFVGLGRVGPEFDFARKVGVIKLFGISIKRFDLGKEKQKEPQKMKVKAERKKAAEPPKPARRVKRSLSDILNVLMKSTGPVWKYLVSVLKAVAVEELEGRIDGGFDSPHLTGAVFGYYQAALAAAPGVVGRVRFTPDWCGPSFSGAARLSVAIPVYKLLFQTITLIGRLPVRDLIKLARGKKKGVSDVQQRR